MISPQFSHIVVGGFERLSGKGARCLISFLFLFAIPELLDGITHDIRSRHQDFLHFTSKSLSVYPKLELHWRGVVTSFSHPPSCTSEAYIKITNQPPFLYLFNKYRQRTAVYMVHFLRF